MLAILLLVLLPGVAHAHHGSTKTAGFANRISGGISGVEARSVVGAALSFQRMTWERAPGNVGLAELYAQYQFTSSLVAGIVVPTLFLFPDSGASTPALGAIALEGKLLSDITKQYRHALVAQLQLPTQTAFLGAEPGAIWVATIGSIHQFQTGQWLTQAGALLSTDYRPAGVALDATLLAVVNRVLGAWSVGLGAEFETRLATGCALRGQFSWCEDGRASEPAGEFLRPLLRARPIVGYSLENQDISLSAYVPLTARDQQPQQLSIAWSASW